MSSALSGPSLDTERFRFAASCLAGKGYRDIDAEDVDLWVSSDLLLPIASALDRASPPRPRWPDWALERLHERRRAAAAVAAGERHVITEVVESLRKRGVSTLLLKGAALAYTVYPDAWLRARSDIDVLVHPGTMATVGGTLASMGFVLAREASHPLITQQRHFTRAGAIPVVLDVHEALVNPPVFRHLPHFDELVTRSQPIPSCGPHARALATLDALLHALVHRVAHHNSSDDLLWLYDVHLLVGFMRESDWATLGEAAARARVCRIAGDGLRAVVNSFGTHVPHELLERLESVRGEPTAALIGGRMTEWQLQWVNFRSLDSVRARVEFVRAHLAPPPGDLPVPVHSGWHLPVRYAGRAVHGARKWLRPISRHR